MKNNPQKGRDQGHVTQFKFWHPNNISGMAETDFNFCMQVLNPSLLWQTTPKIGVVRVTQWARPVIFKFCPNHIL